MTAADDAFAAAERLIAEAMRTGAERLSFDTDETRALTRLPESIAGLSGLKELGLNTTEISDLAPLAGLTLLWELSLNTTQVSNLAPLAELTGLKVLELAYTPVSDLAPLARLTGLKVLDLANTPVSDLAPVAGLTRLARLWLNATPVTDLVPLAGLAGLSELWLNDTQVSDLAPLAGLTELEVLSLNNTQVSDLAPLAGLTWLETLYLNNTQVSDLAPLAGLNGLETLSLNSTPVSDLAPLAGLIEVRWLLLGGSRVSELGPLTEMTKLESLDLDDTQVLDLRPLLGLWNLAGEPELEGLTFKGIPATQDARVAEIAEIENPRNRAAALFALLEPGWVPPGEVEAEPLKQDPLLRSILIDGQLEIDPNPPTEEERRDRVKAALHERLKEKAAELFRAAGNSFPRLANRARAISDLLDVPFDRLDLLSLHLEIEDLEDRRETGAEEGEPFGDEVKQAISGVTRAGPGLTVGHPDVDLLLDRRRKAREEVVVAAEDAAHRRLLQAVIDDPAANGPHSRAMSALLAEVADEAASRALQKSKHQNLLWTVTVVAIGATTDVAYNVAANLIANAYGADVTAFVTTNWTLLSEVAATYGQGVLVWFQQNVGPLVAGIDPTVVRPVKLPKRPK